MGVKSYNYSTLSWQEVSKIINPVGIARSSLKIFQNTAWTEKFLKERAVLNDKPVDTIYGISTFSYSIDNTRVNFSVYGKSNATQYLGFRVDGPFPAGTTISVTRSIDGPTSLIDFQITADVMYGYTYVSGTATVSFTTSNTCTSIYVRVGAYGNNINSGYLENLTINGKVYRFTNN